MAGPSGEDGIIAKYFAPIAGPGGLGLRDDAALIAAPGGCEIVITKDALVAGVHFFADDAPAAIARKALRVNVSDLAAKGANPLGFLLALALPEDLPRGWIAKFARALGADSSKFRIPLLGGDTVATPGPLMLSITALGSVPKGKMVPRTGARAGDRLYVSGTIGDAAIGLYRRSGDALARDIDARSAAHLVSRYLEPQPRLALAPALRAFASGAMDISDGLVGDLRKMLGASGVSGRVELARIPFSNAALKACRTQDKFHDIALTGGDDYEILASVPPKRGAAFEKAAGEAGVRVTCIGFAAKGTRAPDFVDERGGARIFAKGSYSHF